MRIAKLVLSVVKALMTDKNVSTLGSREGTSECMSLHMHNNMHIIIF